MDQILKRKGLPQVRILGRSLVQDPEHAKKRIIPFLTSDETVDRYGDIIRVDGWDLKDYNGAWLWAHNGDETPIGKSRKHGIELVDGRRALVQYPEFAPHDIDPFADKIYKLHVADFLSSCSVGFLPKKTTRPQDDEDRAALGLGKHGVVYEKQELLECSSVSVPANPKAGQMASIAALVQRGILTAKDVEEIDEDAEHFDRGFAVALREEWGRVRAPSVVTVTVPNPYSAQAVADARAAAAADENPALTDRDLLGLLLERVEGLQREVRESLGTKAGGVGGEGDGAEAPVSPEPVPDPVPRDTFYESLLGEARELAACVSKSAGGTGNGERSNGNRSGGAQDGAGR